VAHIGRIGTGTVTTASATGTITVTSGVPSGATVIIGVVWESGAGTIPSVTSIADTRGNTYMVDEDAGGSGNVTLALAILRGRVTTPLQVGDTITVTIGTTRTRWALVAEAFDDLSATPLDQTAANDNPGSATSLATGTTATTTQASELVVAVFGFGPGRTVTIPAGWSGGTHVETAADSVNRAVQLTWQYVSTTGAQQGTLTISPASTYAGAIATYKTDLPSASGSAVISGSATITAAGTPTATGGGSVTGLLAVTATGTATRPAPLLPPRLRTRWQLVAGPATGGHEIGLTEAKDRKYVARLTEPSELSFQLDGRHPQADVLSPDELATDVYLLWTSPAGTTRILDRQRAGAGVGDDITDTEHRVQVNCLDYRAVLNRRRLYEGDTLTYTGVDQGEIAWRLIQATQARTGGDLGISRAWSGNTPTGVTRDVEYAAGDSIGERIQELSEAVDGFDWAITPVSASALQLQVWYPQRGVDRGVVLVAGGNLVARARREFNASDYANAIRYSGADGLTPQELEAEDLAARPEGRWDAVYGDTTLTTQDMLNQRAAWQMEWAQVVRPTWTVTLRRGAWDGPDHIWLGDPVRLVVYSGRLKTDQVLRVYEVEIDLDGDGGETVTLSLGGPRPDYRRRPRQTERRLTNLERR